MTTIATLHLCALSGTAAFALLAGDADRADDTTTAGDAAPRFAAPVRLASGDALLGAKRPYPSPAAYDWNRDGRTDLVVGDLFGKVTVSLRAEDGGLGAEEPIERRDGEALEFDNW